MEGPTPVSALIHAATMVAAGVFLLTRVFFLFSASAEAMLVIAWTGAVTAALAGTLAIIQNDIKKILAYSTLSQLGYMVLALGLYAPEAGMFHLTTHAFFKALLFLGAGSLIHSLHTQNIWEMPSQQGLLKTMPITSWTFLIGTAALIGLPPTSGFFSKEEILTLAHFGPAPLYFLAMLTVFFTAFYMSRLVTIVFLKKGSGPLPSSRAGLNLPYGNSVEHESNSKMTVPLILLAFFSLIGGYLPIRELVMGHVTHSQVPASPVLPISLSLLGFVLAFVIYRRRTATGVQPKAFEIPNFILERKYFFDDAYDTLIRLVQEKIAGLADFFERHILVGLGANGTATLARLGGDLLRLFQTGMVQFYALVFTAGITILIYFFILQGAVA